MAARAQGYEAGGGVDPTLTARMDVMRLQMRSKAAALDTGAVPGDDLLG
jgi:hypothetical protein